ncbi:MAG TPA: cytochrome c [Acidobacteriota bacterium]|nr:cytochrome c [Acidobacteriota bacterium]
MKIPAALKIAVLAIAATIFYTYVGQLVPQKRVDPPEETVIEEDLSPEELAQVGQGIFQGKGLCSTCHTIGKSGALRFPDLSGIATRAATRIPGMGALEYMTHSLYRPNEYIVEGFNPGMPEINRPPIGLSDQEILAVIAYLQTLGGSASVTLDTQLPIPGSEAAQQAAEAPAEAPAAEAPAASAAAGEGPIAKYDCGRCHNLDQPGRLEAASLVDVGARLDRDAIMASILSQHQQEAFMSQATLQELKRMVDLLAAKGGTE